MTKISELPALLLPVVVPLLFGVHWFPGSGVDFV